MQITGTTGNTVNVQPQVSQSKPIFKKTETIHKSEKTKDIRRANITASKGISDVVRTSLGPRGMDKMIQDSRGEVLITNDGATIMKQMEVVHPTAKMMVELSKSQDIEAGDGTTSVVVIAGALLQSCEILLDKGIHPTIISEAFQLAVEQSTKILKSITIPLEISNKDLLRKCVETALASKVVSSNSQELARIAVEAVLSVIDPLTADTVDLKDIKVVKKLGGTIEDTELVEGLVFTNQKISHVSGSLSKIENPKIALIQFCLTAPKTDIENSIVVKDYTAMDRILKEERMYIIDLVKKIAASGANVLLIQKSILRDAVNELSLHFLAKKILLLLKILKETKLILYARLLMLLLLLILIN